MARLGVLERMAKADLEAMIAEVGRGYAPGALETLSAHDPVWRGALDEAERELGETYAALCEADAALVRWRRALAELHRLWARAGETSGAPGVSVELEEVA